MHLAAQGFSFRTRQDAQLVRRGATEAVARVTEAGTLELEAVALGGNERWKVEFDVRGERQEPAEAT